MEAALWISLRVFLAARAPEGNVFAQIPIGLGSLADRLHIDGLQPDLQPPLLPSILLKQTFARVLLDAPQPVIVEDVLSAEVATEWTGQYEILGYRLDFDRPAFTAGSSISSESRKPHHEWLR